MALVRGQNLIARWPMSLTTAPSAFAECCIASQPLYNTDSRS